LVCFQQTKEHSSNTGCRLLSGTVKFGAPGAKPQKGRQYLGRGNNSALKRKRIGLKKKFEKTAALPLPFE